MTRVRSGSDLGIFAHLVEKELGQGLCFSVMKEVNYLIGTGERRTITSSGV